MPTSPLRSRALAPLALALFTALAGCGDPIAPEDVVGTYVLTRVDGREVPAVVALWTLATPRAVGEARNGIALAGAVVGALVGLAGAALHLLAV